MNDPLSLISEKTEVLFQEAQRIGKNKKNVFCCPIGVTTKCESNPPCRHCQWQSKAKLNPYYSRDMARDEVIFAAQEITKEGRERIYMVSGCAGHDLPGFFFDRVQAVRENSTADIYGFFGPISKKSLSTLKSVGMTGYWCGIESPKKTLFEKVRPGDDYEARFQTLYDTKELGLKAWSGFVFGLGESEMDMAGGIQTLKEMEIDSVTMLPFTPCPDTEMEQEPPPSLYQWARMIAISRICLENADVIILPEHALWGLKAGANGYLHMYTKSTGPLPSRQELVTMRQNIYQ